MFLLVLLCLYRASEGNVRMSCMLTLHCMYTYSRLLNTLRSSPCVVGQVQQWDMLRKYKNGLTGLQTKLINGTISLLLLFSDR